jgi:hypothetical protein
MKRRNTALMATILGVLLPSSSALAQAKEVKPSWKLVATHVESRSPTSLGDHTIYAAFSGEAAAKFEVSTVTFMDKVTQVAVNGDKIMVIGSGAGPDEAITIDARSRSVVSRSVALSMRLFANKWLVSVEWYPNHLFPPQYPNDVVLVQDIQRGEQQCPSKPSDEPSGFSALVRAAGRPVYPAKNAAECSYSNVQNDNDSILRAYPKTFALTPDGRLLFLTSSGPDRDVQLLSLVAIPLVTALKGEFSVTQQSLTSVYADLKLDKNEVLQVDHLEPVKGDAVRIVFSKGSYGINQVIVPLRSP